MIITTIIDKQKNFGASVIRQKYKSNHFLGIQIQRKVDLHTSGKNYP